MYAETVEGLSETMRRFIKRGDDDDEVAPPDARQVALRCVQAFASLKMALLLLDALESRVTEMGTLLRALLLPLIEKADLDDAARAEMLDAVQHLGSVTVAEQDLDRLRMQIVGDLAALVDSGRGETDS